MALDINGLIAKLYFRLKKLQEKLNNTNLLVESKLLPFIFGVLGAGHDILLTFQVEI